MYSKSILALVLAIGSSVGLTAQEPQDRATVQLRDGTKVEGRIEALGRGTLFLPGPRHGVVGFDRTQCPERRLGHVCVERRGPALR